MVRFPRTLAAIAILLLVRPGRAVAGEPSPDELVGLLAKDDKAYQANQDLVALGRRAVPALIKGLKSADRTIQTRSVTALGEIRDAAAIGPLVELAEKDPPGSFDALVALGNIGGPEAGAVPYRRHGAAFLG